MSKTVWIAILTIGVASLLTTGCDDRELDILTSELATGIVGVPYQHRIKATKDHGKYYWKRSSGELPPGLSLIGKGNNAFVKGTPTSVGVFVFEVSVSDSSGHGDTRRFEITIAPDPAPTLEITTKSLPFASTGINYVAPVEATGGSGTDYSWSVVEGSLPSGMSIDASGTPSSTIQGAPTVSGLHAFKIQVQDSVGRTAIQPMSIDVDPPLQITNTSLSNAMVGQSFDQQLTAYGGSGQGYVWSITSGSLPSGTVFSDLGSGMASISGLPTSVQLAVFTVSVTDSANNVDARQYTIEVFPALSITPTALSNGRIGQPYTEQLWASGGSGQGYLWSVVSGNLPPGLSLGSGPSATSSIIGMPTQLGQFPFTVEVTDSLGFSVVQPIQIDVVDHLEILPPLANSWTYGVGSSLTVSAIGGSGTSYIWSILSGSLPMGLVLSQTGTPSTIISGVPAEIGTFNLTVRVQDSIGGSATRPLNITVQGGTTLVITTNSIPFGTPGVPYLADISASGGTNGGYTWSIVSGTLHPDFSLGTTGSPTTTISGNPSTTASSSMFTVQVEDSLGATATKQLALDVFDPISITTTMVADGDTSQNYTQQISAVGGNVTSYVWSVVGGSLPNGLALSTTGSPATISGTPVTTGTFAFEVRVEDNTGSFDTQSFSMVIFGPGIIETYAGDGSQNFLGNGSNKFQTGFFSPFCVAFAPNGDMYMADGEHNIYRIDGSTDQMYHIAGDGQPGFLGDGLDASQARFRNPRGILVDAAGNIYIADSYNDRIRRIDAITNVITTFAGGGPSGIGDGQIATLAQFDRPWGLSWAQNGDMLICEFGDKRIRRIDMSTTVITTFIGGNALWTGDGPAATVGIGSPAAVVEAPNGDLYYTDFHQHAIRRYNAVDQTIETLAGTGGFGISATGGQAKQATIGRPFGIALNASGDVLFSEERNHRILRIDLTTGVLHSFAGTGQNAGYQGLYSGDNGPAEFAELDMPTILIIGPDGHLYFADRGNEVIRRVRQ